MNWLALGILLAAWNASDNDQTVSRPDTLRGYASVSVRAVTRKVENNTLDRGIYGANLLAANDLSRDYVSNSHKIVNVL